MNNASAVEIMQGLRRLHELEDKAADLGPKQELPSDEAALIAGHSAANDNRAS